MKPESIRKFDMFYLGSLVISAAGFFLGYDALVAQIGAEGAARGLQLGPGVAIASFVVGMCISLLLWWLTSAKRVAIAKWIIVLLFVLGLLGLPATLAGGITMIEGVSLLSIVAQAVAIWYLFRPDAKAWLAGEAAADSPTVD